MLAHLHRCQLLTQPNLGEGGVARKVLQDRCRPSWQSPRGLRNALTDAPPGLRLDGGDGAAHTSEETVEVVELRPQVMVEMEDVDQEMVELEQQLIYPDHQ